MATKLGAILLRSTQGSKYDGSVVKKILPWTTSYTPVDVLSGQLVVKCHQAYHTFNYQLHSNSNVYMICDEHSVAPLSTDEFLLLEAIKSPEDRLETFRQKLDWGISLKQGESVYLTKAGETILAPQRSRVVVHYKGKVGNLPGVMFGVEIMVYYVHAILLDMIIVIIVIGELLSKKKSWYN